MAPLFEPDFPQLIRNLFQTKTISPSYKIPHILLTIMVLGEEKDGIGRYRIKSEVGLGEGTIKTLLNRLRDEGIIEVQINRQSGHKLTENGRIIFHHITSSLAIPLPLNNPQNKYVIGTAAFFTVIPHAKAILPMNALKMRDEAIKIGGTGSTTLEIRGDGMWFPGTKSSLDIPDEISLQQPQEGDIVVIGGGDHPTVAVLATLAAALPLIFPNAK